MLLQQTHFPKQSSDRTNIYIIVFSLIVIGLIVHNTSKPSSIVRRYDLTDQEKEEENNTSK